MELEIALNNMLSDAQKICIRLDLENNLSFERFKTEFTGGGSINFSDFIKEQIKHREVNKLVGKVTIVNDRKALKTLLHYKSNINLADINAEFLEGYVGFLKKEKVSKQYNMGKVKVHSDLF